MPAARPAAGRRPPALLGVTLSTYGELSSASRLHLLGRARSAEQNLRVVTGDLKRALG